MKTINVEHLPEPVAHAVQALVDTLRGQFHLDTNSVDAAKVKAAVLARRKTSRTLKQDWENVDVEASGGGPHAGK